MRLSKAWLVATRDFRVFRRQKSIWYSIVIFPVLVSVIFPAVLEYTLRRRAGISAAQLLGLINSFSFFIVIGAAFVPLGIASYSIVGEKVEKSLEPLLATPLSDGEILLGKTIAAVLPSLVAMYAGASVFMAGINLASFQKLGYYYYPNWTIGALLLILTPIATILSAEYSVIVSSRANDVRSANSFGIFILFPLLAIFLASETGLITLDTNTILIISGIILVIDIALFFASKAAFQREEILTKWK